LNGHAKGANRPRPPGRMILSFFSLQLPPFSFSFVGVVAFRRTTPSRRPFLSSRGGRRRDVPFSLVALAFQAVHMHLSLRDQITSPIPHRIFPFFVPQSQRFHSFSAAAHRALFFSHSPRADFSPQFPFALVRAAKALSVTRLGSSRRFNNSTFFLLFSVFFSLGIQNPLPTIGEASLPFSGLGEEAFL